MAYEIRYSAVAVQQLRKLRAVGRSASLEEVARILAVNPTLESKARVKLLRQPAPTQFRLRVGEYRIFYDVENEAVNIIQVLDKQGAIRYLEEST